jgi:hypothetical protein
MAYDAGGIKTLKLKPIGGLQRENMTLVQEQALLVRFADAAGAGEMLNIHDLKSAMQKRSATKPATVRSTILWRAMAGARRCRVGIILNAIAPPSRISFA